MTIAISTAMNKSRFVRGDAAVSIAVVGAGAMGCYFGGLLSKAGHGVCLIDLDPQQIALLNSKGLLLETDTGRYWLPVRAALARDLADPVDLVILFTKTLHSDAAMASVQHLLRPQTVVVSLQNGLGNAECIARYHPRSYIVVGTTLVPADLQGPGHVVSHGPSSSRLMDADALQPEWLSSVVRLFNQAGLQSEIEPDIQSLIWSKVAFNAALNAMCAVTGATPGVVAQFEAAVGLAMAVVTETVGVALKAGIRLDEAAIIRQVEMALTQQPDHKPSMLQDIEHKRLTEIDAINGAVVATATRLGMDAPVNRTLVALVKLKETLRT
jgi:2-dehydropantoate 2-reductase